MNMFELRPASALDYFHSLAETPPDDTPEADIAILSLGSEKVAVGFRQLWNAAHMRRVINSFSASERRTFEENVRNEMASLDREIPEELLEWTELHHIHHWSVTADQAEMLARSFVCPLI